MIIELDTEMNMPTPCQNCGDIFDLNDGIGSEKWFPNTIICATCGNKERSEIERDEEIEQLNLDIDDAEHTLRTARARLAELSAKSEPSTGSPRHCPKCSDRLYKCNVVNVETGADMGHIWRCFECDLRYVGFGEPGEYDGTPKDGAVAKEVA